MGMKKALIILGITLSILSLLFWFLIKSNGYEITQKDKYPNIPYFPKLSDANFNNVAIDSLHVINYHANKHTIFVNYSKTDDLYRENFIVLTNKSFKNLAYRKLAERDSYRLDTLDNLLVILKNDTVGKVANCEIINSTNGDAKNAKEIDAETYAKIGNFWFLVKHQTNASHDTELLIFKNKIGEYIFLQGDEANKTAKKLILTELQSFDNGVSIKIGGDPEIKHPNINLFDHVVTDNSFKRLLNISTPSSNANPSENRMTKNEGYLANKGWFDKSRIYYFKMRLATAETSFKTDGYWYSDLYFDQLNTPKSNQDTLFYYAKNKIYKFYKVKKIIQVTTKL